MQLFDPAAKCPKCGEDNISSAYHPPCGETSCWRCHECGRVGSKVTENPGRVEHIKRYCVRCSFEWAEACIGNGGPTP